MIEDCAKPGDEVRELMEQCKILEEYAQYVERVRKNAKVKYL